MELGVHFPRGWARPDFSRVLRLRTGRRAPLAIGWAAHTVGRRILNLSLGRWRYEESVKNRSPLPRRTVAIAVCAVLVAACQRSSGEAQLGPVRAPSQPLEPALQFASMPTEARANEPLPEIAVTVLDSSGQPTETPTPVRLSLLPNREGARLLGNTTTDSLQGIARFNGVSVDRGGSYRLLATAADHVPALGDPIVVQRAALHLILMIADGWGYKQLEATEKYTGRAPFYTAYTSYPMSTYDVTTLVLHKGVGYNPARAWSLWEYPILSATDSAASATAMYTGEKTYNGRVATSITDSRLMALAEMADLQGLGTGAVSSVPLPHATPGAWIAHNTNRNNYYAIADEMLWRNPNTTGTGTVDARYEGGVGVNTFDPTVIIAGGHPGWNQGYMRAAMRDKLAQENGQPGAWTFVERRAGQNDGGARLLAAAGNTGTQRLCGLFGGREGNIEFRRANGSGASRENPTLAEMTRAALRVLERKPAGFALMVEAGAVDFAGHSNNLDNCIGEMIGYEEAVQAVVDWVDAPGNAADWDNTLLVVTGDHECGYLTAGVRSFIDAPFGEISARTLALEKAIVATGRRASWEDLNNNLDIDAGEPVYWVWNTGGHSNSLIPLFVRGNGASRFAAKTVGTDPVRGSYIDDTAVFQVMRDVLLAPR